MRRVVVLTGSELRHEQFRIRMARDGRFDVMLTVCEGPEDGLAARVAADPEATDLMRRHAAAQAQAEHDAFSAWREVPDMARPMSIPRSGINDEGVQARIREEAPDVIVCYGSSVIRGPLIEDFAGRFVNVHPGLAPWYRGADANVWPLIQGKPGHVGATFLHPGADRDSGRIIHQIRPEIVLGDGPHSIGNRVIDAMTRACADVVAAWDALEDAAQPKAKGRHYAPEAFDAAACERLYARFGEGMIADYLDGMAKGPGTVRNAALD